MPISKDKSNVHQLRDEVQNLLCLYGSPLLKQVMNEVGISPISDVPVEECVTFEQSVNYYLTSSSFLGLSSSSKTTYSSELNQFKKYVLSTYQETIPIKDIAKASFLSRYLEPYQGSNTHAKKSAFLRSFFSTIFRHFYNTDVDYLKRYLKVSFVKDYLPRAFTKAQLAELLTLAQASSKSLRNCTVIWTFLGTGIRLNELCQLRIGDVDPVGQNIFVVAKGKPKKQKRKISKLSLIILTDYINFTYTNLRNKLPKEEYEQLFIFSNDGGTSAIQNRTIQYMISDLIEKSESIPKENSSRYGAHTFRHCFAVYGLDSGIDIYTLSKLLGHSSIQNTEIYLKLFDDQLRNAIEQHPFAKMELLNIMRRMDDFNGHID